MAESSGNCVGCDGSLQEQDFMKCKDCSQKYDLLCANLSPKRFRSFNEAKKRKWVCPECVCKLPKGDNNDTPARSTKRQQPPSNLAAPTGSDESSTSTSNVTTRKKSPVPIPLPVSVSYITEERLREMWQNEMIKELKSMINSSNRDISGQLTTINGQCADFQESLLYVSKQYDDLRKEISDLKQLFGNTTSEIKGLKEENKSLKQNLSACVARVKLLEEENLKQQQWARIQNVEITGIPEHKDEITTDLVMKVSEHIGVAIQPTDIEFAHRVQPRRAVSASHARPIVVRLRQRIIKDHLVAAARKHRNLTARDVGFASDTQKVYVNEHLTKDNKMLLGACKQKAKEVGYKYAWTKNCRVFVRKDDNSPPIPVNSSADLVKIA